MAEKANFKTNALRILENMKINYTLHKYEHGDEFSGGLEIAEKLGQKPEQVFKTIVTHGQSRENYVFVLPVNKEIDFKAAARAVGEKSIEMIKLTELTKITGYIRGGCSPIGMKKKFRTVIDESCRSFDTIMVSAGKVGCQMELAPSDLIKAAECDVTKITQG
ncbi:MAG: Cys-tRNA(Pro) deacylase [Ruminococcaceae bacterium]|nr:Cys-tRNA(Pro) deacylase [Oscillospiraceae bacterium]